MRVIRLEEGDWKFLRDLLQFHGDEGPPGLTYKSAALTRVYRVISEAEEESVNNDD